MNITEINTKLTTASGADTNTYTAAERLIDVNNAYLKVWTMITDCADEQDPDDTNHADFPMLTTPMVASQRNYTIPAAERVVNVKKVSVTYDGTDWYEALPLDSGEIDVPTAPSGTAMETTIDGLYSKSAPRYDYHYNAIAIYPRASADDVTNGAQILIEWTRDPDLFTSAQVTTGTKEPGFDQAFHPLLYLIPALNWCVDKVKTERIPGLRDQVADLEARLRRQYGKKERSRRGRVSAEIVSYK